MTPEQTLDWLAEQHKSQCNEDRPVQEWIRSMKSMLPAPVQDVPEVSFGNMTKDEALDLALEALELNNSEWKSLADSGDAGFWSAEEQEHYKQTEAAITAIKQARSAQVQEPVADVYMAGSMKTNIGTNGRVVYVSTVYSEKPLVKGDKLYTTPPTARPAPPECQTEAEKTAFAFGWWKALESVRQPAVPDAFGTREGEHPQYVQGWNDCRAEMLGGVKP
jgi:hypothetical protein